MEHHADLFAQIDDIDVWRIDVLIFKVKLPVIVTSSSRSFMRLMQRRYVDLPQPEGPIKAVISFS